MATEVHFSKSSRWRCTDVRNNSEWLFLGAGSFPVCRTGKFWEAHRGAAGWDNSVLLAQGKVISSVTIVNAAAAGGAGDGVVSPRSCAPGSHQCRPSCHHLSIGRSLRVTDVPLSLAPPLAQTSYSRPLRLLLPPLLLQCEGFSGIGVVPFPA